MNHSELASIMRKHSLRQADVAWMNGVTSRQVRSWCTNSSPVPRSAAIILQAYDEGIISAAWLKAKVGPQSPGSN